MPKSICLLVKIFLHTSAVLILSGCGSTTPITTSTNPETKISTSLDSITELLNEADRQNHSDRISTYLDVAQALLDADEIDWARNTMAQLSPLSVPDNQYIRYTVISSALLLAQGQPFQAKAVLWQDRLQTIAEKSPSDEVVELQEMRAQLLHRLGEYRQSVDERLKLHLRIKEGSEQSALNQQALWQTLMELPFADLKLEGQIHNEMLAKGWYTLAALSKNNQTNLRQQIHAVESWMFSWPEHPASLALPADLQLLKQLAEDKPDHIAILLPYSGRFKAAATAIQDGMMAAYYDASTQDDVLPDLRIYDTSSNDINTLYDEAVLNGAELVIGPLEQKKIIELALRPELPVPTLALNRISDDLVFTHGLFQFGLPLEDEAEQVAEQAWKDGHRRAMILAPASAGGDRSVKSFNDKWTELGGEITNDYRYKNQSGYSNLIKAAVKIEESEQRKNRVRSIIGKRVEFEPRRRKDIDFIFLYSQASQARQLKPILAFHYAGDVPVYAIKDIYNGQVNTKRDKDLNEIRFTTLPWLFEQELPEKRAISHYIPSTNYQFLYALGVDAYHIHPRLRQLMEVKQAHFYGTTGKLSLDGQQKIRREQIWAKFINGTAVPVATFSAENDL